jgi:hypothetical protein
MVGGLAAAVHGCPSADTTVVIVPARFSRNLERLSRVLRELNATPRQAVSSQGVVASGRPLARTGRTGQTRMRTDLGAFEVDFEPPGTAGHLDVYDSARRFAITPTLTVEVACPADLLRIAETRRSPADMASLGDLREAVAGYSTGTTGDFEPLPSDEPVLADEAIAADAASADTAITARATLAAEVPELDEAAEITVARAVAARS